MPRYISLMNWTEQGIRTVTDTVDRGRAASSAFKAGGGAIVEIYWTQGPYDAVVIFDAPDEATAMRLVLVLGRHGNVRSMTMRAFNAEEMGAIVGGLT